MVCTLLPNVQSHLRKPLKMAKFLLVEARFYGDLNDLLLNGARAALDAAGHTHETLTVPGALEIPAVIARAAEARDYAGYVALGVVIRGETYHFELVAGESARGIMALTLDGLAIGNGILTVENEAQALVRARPDDKDKGGAAAKAAMALYEIGQRFTA
jgi:6,7-dimethyl-8-ribityllumazine synthase